MNNPSRPDRIYSISSVFFIALAITLVRVFYLWLNNVEFAFDEAQYWTWSKNLQFGYFSKPPIIAWIIAAATQNCGDSIFCIRLPAPFIHLIITIFVYKIAQHVFNEITAFWSAIIYITMPAVTVSSTFISTDAPLLLFWTISIYFFIRAIEKPASIWWLLLGISIGLGMLSKYTMVAFPVSMCLFFLITKGFRKYLFSFSFIFSMLIAAVVFSPNIIWNIDNNFVSFMHTEDNVLSKSISLRPRDLLEFLAAQFGLFGPIMMLILIRFLFFSSQIYTLQGKELVSFIIPLLTAAIIISLISGAQAHWAAPIYIPATILVTNYLVRKNLLSLIRESALIAILIAAAIYHYNAFSNFAHIDHDPFARFKAWNMLRKEAVSALEKHPETYLMSDERKAVATLMYNLRQPDGTPYTVIKWNNDGKIRDYYDMNTNLSALKGKDFIFISRGGDENKINGYFDSVQKIKSVNLAGTKFYIYYLRNYR